MCIRLLILVTQEVKITRQNHQHHVRISTKTPDFEPMGGITGQRILPQATQRISSGHVGRRKLLQNRNSRGKSKMESSFIIGTSLGIKSANILPSLHSKYNY